MILHRLDGCAPVPLAHYLKALGVLRLVSEQLDPEARGWWEGERFLLASHADEPSLLAFLLDEYAPTPLVSPWNKGSGFFYKDDAGLSPIENSTAARLEPARKGIRAARELLDALSGADARVRSIKAEAKTRSLDRAARQRLKDSDEYRQRLAEAERVFKARKADLMPELRRTWRGPHLDWMNVAMVLDEQSAPRFPALLGTGGNDGRLDFTNNFFQRLGDVLDLAHEQARSRPAARAALRDALFVEPSCSLICGITVGQFAPGAAGGANADNTPSADSLLNPWDFILMLEGALLFTAASTRRLSAQASSRAAAPFAISAQGAGYASAADSDESARGEQWMPLWSHPIRCAELHHLLAEGRAQLGARSVTEPLDLARAVARLGTARGIHAFQRYGYIERNGQSNLAVPLGRFVVPDQATSLLACLEDLEVWLPRLRLQARDTKTRKAPASLKQAERRLADALFTLTQHPDEPARWQTVLLCLADIESLQVHGAGRKAGPIPRLRPEWVQAADDGSTELRLALAFALQCADARGGARRDGVRRHWLTLDKGRYKEGSATEVSATDRVLQGRSGIDDAIALVARRLIEARQRGERRLPLASGSGIAASQHDKRRLPLEPGCGIAASRHDLTRLLAGEVDLDRCLALARALMPLDTGQAAQRPPRLQRPAPADWPDDAWLAIRLAMLPWPLPDDRRPGIDPAVLRRLQAGDLASALELALRRLRAAGIRCTLQIGSASPAIARLYAAALAFPIDPSTAMRFAQRLDPTKTTENAA